MVSLDESDRGARFFYNLLCGKPAWFVYQCVQRNRFASLFRQPCVRRERFASVFRQPYSLIIRGATNLSWRILLRDRLIRQCGDISERPCSPARDRDGDRQKPDRGKSQNPENHSERYAIPWASG